MVKYVRNDKTVSGRLHHEMVMMDIDQGKYFSLNQTATTVWEMLEEPCTVEDICERLTGEYEIEAEQCKREVEEYLSEMMGLGLIIQERE